ICGMQPRMAQNAGRDPWFAARRKSPRTDLVSVAAIHLTLTGTGVYRGGFALAGRVAKTNVSEGFCALGLSAACCAGDESGVSAASRGLAAQRPRVSSVHRGRARKQGGAIRLPDVWAVRIADHRLRLSDDLPEAAAQWAVWRSLARRAVRGAS